MVTLFLALQEATEKRSKNDTAKGMDPNLAAKRTYVTKMIKYVTLTSSGHFSQKSSDNLPCLRSFILFTRSISVPKGQYSSKRIIPKL